MEDRNGMKEKSLKVNMILNSIKGLMSVLFPLISFPYISRVLGVDNVGKYNFTNSIISYFILLAGLGIATYAVREGARIRNNKVMLESFVAQVFTINVVSTVFSYIVLFATILIIPELHSYKSLLVILSLQVLFKTLGVDWIYSIYEDFTYTTIRSIIFQILSLACMFLFVRTENDVNVYAAITALAAGGSGVINFWHAKRYCRISLTKKLNLKYHLRPIIILFALAVTVTIYVSSDTTILGFICGDSSVGIYSVSVKVYTIVKAVLTYVLMVSIPHLAAALGAGDEQRFNSVSSELLNTLITFVIPATLGLILLRRNIVLSISGAEYIEAESSLALLSIALIFGMLSYYWSQCILINYKKDSLIFKVTAISAIVNIVLNLIFIPVWKENAAALTTIIAEGISCCACWFHGRKYVKLNKVFDTSWKVVLGCIPMAIITIILRKILTEGIKSCLLIIAVDVFVYGLLQVFCKNAVVIDILNAIKEKLSK